MQSEGDEGGICVVAESCHQTSEGIGLIASTIETCITVTLNLSYFTGEYIIDLF